MARSRFGRHGGYDRCNASCTTGRSKIPTAALMMCSTSSTTRTFSPSRGNGCGATRAHGQPVSTGSPASIAEDAETVAFLGATLKQLKARTFAPLPVRERLIPKPGSSKLRRLGIPTAMDRTVQASLLLVLEPIFEADFEPVSYGFRPERRAQDAIAEIHALGTRNYHWVFEADIAACFDELAHSAIMERVRTRIVDKRVLALIKAFLKAGIMSGDGTVRESDTGTPRAAYSHRCWPTSL